MKVKPKGKRTINSFMISNVCWNPLRLHSVHLGMKPSPPVIVVAEDEPLIRLLVVDVLTDEGFTVIEAEHGDAAVGILEKQAAGIHLLFTDVHMPGTTDGIELAHHTDRNYPWIAVLVSSGKARPDDALFPVSSRFLPKPYRLGEVVTLVCELAAARQALMFELIR